MHHSIRHGFDAGALPSWLPEDVFQYLAHTGAGLSIRDLARRSHCHASTVSRRIRRVEQQRDDPLVDAALRQMEQALSARGDELKERMKEGFSKMKHIRPETELPALPKNFDKEAQRVLRRLCETGAVLAIAADMDMAVVVREGTDGTTTRTAVVAQEVTQAMALKGWIETASTRRILRYTVTTAGREVVRDMLDRDEGGAAALAGMNDAAAAFEPAGQAWAERRVQDGPGGARRVRYNLADSPLTLLARRRDKNGELFLTDDLVRAGERLREDFELAQMKPRPLKDWDRFISSGGPAAAPDTPARPPRGNGPDAAQARVVAALKDLGPRLSDVALRCCCFLEGLEATEQRMGWSARSGKIVLRIALQRLKRHYAETLTPDSHLIG